MNVIQCIHDTTGQVQLLLLCKVLETNEDMSSIVCTCCNKHDLRELVKS